MRLRAALASLLVLGVACGGSGGGEEQPALGPGDRAPAFELTSAQGERIALRELRGRPVLLYFSMGPG